MIKIASILIKIYKNFFSGTLELLFGKGCRFSPTCSEYTHAAISKYGIIRGSLFGLKRISRCHPFTKPQFDPVP